MIGVTASQFPLNSLAKPLSGNGSDGQVVGVLTAHAPGAIGEGVGETLRRAAVPGNLLTGTISDLQPGVSFTIVTRGGAEISVRWPQGVPLNLGSAVTLKLSFTGENPQLTLLSVDGRPLGQRISGDGSGAGAGAGALAASLPNPAAQLPVPQPPANGASLLASLGPRITLEDENALEAALSPEAHQASAAESADLLTATLLHPAPARLGQTPLPVGTRYVVTLGTGEEPPPAVADSSIEAALLRLIGDTAGDYSPQAALIAGRVSGQADNGQTLIETALGVLMLATPTPPPPGSAVRLRIVAVAPPETRRAGTAGTTDGADAAAGHGLVEDLIDEWGGEEPDLLTTLFQSLLMPTDETLLAALCRQVTSPAIRAELKARATAAALLLSKNGKGGLAARVEAAASELSAGAKPLRDGWAVLSLPYLGLAGNQPVRVYFRGNPPEESDKRKGGGTRHGRVVLEVSLAKLGVLQFDGLARERQFDLMLRSEQELDPALRHAIRGAFDETLGACGHHGAIEFARVSRFPFQSPDRDAPHALGVSV